MTDGKDLKIGTWNVEGLLNRLDSSDFVSFLKSFDICCLTETFIDYEFQCEQLSEYSFVSSFARKLSHRGRKSGGVIVCFRKKFSNLIKQVKVDYENMIVLHFDKLLFATDRDIFFIGLYVPPCESAVYGVTQNGYGIEPLEQCVTDLYDKFDNFYIIVCGDLNARTGCQNGIVDMLTDPLSFDSEEVFQERNSLDSIKNVFGNQLIDFCSMFNCSIVNGLSDRGFDDGFTYISNTGSSVIDYIIVSNDLFSVEFVSSFEIAPRVESSHLPLSIYARANQSPCDDVNKTGNFQWTEKIIWDCDKLHEFLSSLTSQSTVEELSLAFNEIDVNADSALDKFVSCLLKAASCMKKRVRVGVNSEVKDALWFDSDCREAKRNAKHLLKAFRKETPEKNGTSRDEKRLAYVQARKEYRRLIKEKKKLHLNEKRLKNYKLLSKIQKYFGGK